MFFPRASIIVLAVTGAAFAAPSARATCDVPGTLNDYKSEVSTLLGQLGQQYYSGRATVESLSSGFNQIVAETAAAEQEIIDNCEDNNRRKRQDAASTVSDVADNVKAILEKVSSILGDEVDEISSKVDGAFQSLNSTASNH